MSLRRLTERVVLVIPLLGAVALAACASRSGGDPGASADGGADASRGDASADAEVEQNPQPRLDKRGILVPDRAKQALGAPIPLGFERRSQSQGTAIYRGYVEGEKVFRFYQEYVETPMVRHAKKGWIFQNATPRRPGDPSRVVDILIIKVGRRSTQVTISDRQGFRSENTATPPEDTPSEEELFQKAHQGVGSVRNPIPGTY